MEGYRIVQNPCVIACNGHCCRVGVRIEMYPREAEVLVNGGTQLLSYGPAYIEQLTQVYEQIRKDAPHLSAEEARILARQNVTHTYELMSNCGMLTNEGLCKVYGTDLQPEACRNSMPGEVFCRDARYAHGLNAVQDVKGGNYRIRISDIKVNS